MPRQSRRRPLPCARPWPSSPVPCPRAGCGGRNWNVSLKQTRGAYHAKTGNCKVPEGRHVWGGKIKWRPNHHRLAPLITEGGKRVYMEARGVGGEQGGNATLTDWPEAASPLVLLQLVVLHNLLAPLRCVHAQEAPHALCHLLKRQVPDALLHLASAHRTLYNLFHTSPVMRERHIRKRRLILSGRRRVVHATGRKVESKHGSGLLLADRMTKLALVDRGHHDTHTHRALESAEEALLQFVGLLRLLRRLALFCSGAASILIPVGWCIRCGDISRLQKEAKGVTTKSYAMGGTSRRLFAQC